LSVRHHTSANPTAALKHSHDDSLAVLDATGLHGGQLAAALGVHVPSLTSDVGLVYLHFAVQHSAFIALDHQADTVEHEPSGFLSDAQRAGNLMAADSVLAVHDQPDARQPLVE